MTPQRIKELRRLCAAAKWDSVSDSVEAREDLEFGKYKPGPGDLS